MESIYTWPACWCMHACVQTRSSSNIYQAIYGPWSDWTAVFLQQVQKLACVQFQPEREYATIYGVSRCSAQPHMEWAGVVCTIPGGIAHTCFKGLIEFINFQKGKPWLCAFSFLQTTMVCLSFLQTSIFTAVSSLIGHLGRTKEWSKTTFVHRVFRNPCNTTLKC